MNITNKDNNIIQVCNTSIILLIFMSDIFGNDLVSCGNHLLTQRNEFVSCGNKLPTCANNILSCGNNLLACVNEL